MLQIKNIKKLLRIDPNALDTESLLQPSLMFDMGVLFANQAAQKDRAEMRLDVARARISAEIRKDPAGHGLQKDTDPAIKSAVEIHEDVVSARRDVIEAHRRQQVLKAGFDAFKDKSIQIGRAIQLHLAGYFGRAQPPEGKFHGDVSRMRQDELETVNQEVMSGGNS